MAVSYGAFPAGVNVGYVHFDVMSGGQFVFLGGGSYVDILNWKLTGGLLSSNPDTSGWGSKQTGALWFNTSEGNFFGWNGSAIVYLG